MFRRSTKSATQPSRLSMCCRPVATRTRVQSGARTSAASPCIARVDGDTVVVLSVIDNLVKGAAGQAVQNMNLMFGLPESHRNRTRGLAAVTLIRTIKRRFGIAAPRVAIHTHVPWYWRWLSIIVVSGLALGVAWLTYDFGRQYAGFDQGEAQREKSRLERSQFEPEG